MKNKSFALVCLLFLLILAGPVYAAPLADGGGLPASATPTPTFTPVPTETPTPTQTQQILAVTIDLPTNTPASLDFQQPSNILAEPTAALPAESGGNQLALLAYMGLFIILVAGIWMLFGRRAGRKQP